MRVFDDQLLARLRALRLNVRRILSGSSGAGARSSRAGGRVDFQEHRPYAEGDDFREIDWALYGRLEQLFVKRFTDETDWEIHVVLDRSGSMASGEPSKDVQARRIAAAFAFALAGAGRPVAVHALGARLEGVGPAVRDQAGCATLVGALEALGAPGGAHGLGDVRGLFQPGVRNRHVVILSDFLEAAAPAVLGVARSGKVGAALLAVVDPRERAPSARGRARFAGLEGEGTVGLVVGRAVLARYRELFEEHLRSVEQVATRHAMGFAEISTAEPVDAAFLRVVGQGRVL